MNIVILMAGKSESFQNAGINTPKPYIDIKGKTMVQRAYESLNLKGKYNFVALKAHKEEYKVEETIRSFCPDAKIIYLPEVTSGPAETLYKLKDEVPGDEPLIQTNVDQVLEWDSSRFEKFIEEKDPDSAVVTINTCDPHYSFIKLDKNFKGMRLSEKEPCSNNGLIGTHYWKKASMCFSSYEGAVEKNYRYPLYDENIAEVYVSLTFNDLLDRGYEVLDFKLKQDEKQHVVGDVPSLSQYEDRL